MSDENEPAARGSENSDEKRSPESLDPKVTAEEYNPNTQMFPVIGIGSSAGGLEALKKFLAATPPDTGMAFVLIQHLDPTHESLMVDLLARYTAMKVVQIENDMPVEPDRIHIIPPGTSLTIKNGVLLLGKPIERRGMRMPVDNFFMSLAQDQQENAVCIILSGTGSDGTLGLKEIKARGGLAMVQAPETAQYDGMPRSAIMTGLVDYVLPVEQIPSTLVGYVRHSLKLDRLSEPMLTEAEEKLHKILTLLHVRTGHDFRYYKKNTLVRRLQRRMTVNHVTELDDYLDLIQKRPEELEAFDRDLLISVTMFFREPEVWESLQETVIPKLIDGCAENQPVRIWVPGCATGEEAYSLAIMLIEEAEKRKRECPVQIYATDIDKEALEAGRRGLYPENITDQVSHDRLTRFFTRDADGMYQVIKRIREMVVFAPQNLISDPPFSKLDLISCRNVLIYIQTELQKKIVTLFHFALKDGGYLALGNSESVGQRTDLFQTVSKRWRIYRQISSVSRSPLDLPLGLELAKRPGGLAYKPPVPQAIRYADIAKTQLIQQFTPPSVLINNHNETLFFSGITRGFLSLPEGTPTDNVIDMADPALRPKLRTALHKAGTEKREVVLGGIRLSHGDGSRTVRLTVAPVRDGNGDAGLFLVSFEYEPRKEPAPALDQEEISEESVIRSLEEELKRSKEELQATIEQMETSNEELKASNEEVMSMNEELQSSNEELETSREELQSLNEELSTLNSQLQDKVNELEVMTDDLNNLLTSTNIATIFMSEDFRVKRYTPAATQLLNLIPGDIGRPLQDITRKFSDDTLFDDARNVLHKLVPMSREVRSDDGKWYMRRVHPYRTQENRIEGVVVTFSDVTELKETRQQVEQYAAIVESSQDAIYVKSPEGVITNWNRGAEHMYGYSADEIIGKPITLIVPEERKEEVLNVLAKISRGETAELVETDRVRKDGRRIMVSLSLSPVRDAQGTIIGASAIARDITAQKKAKDEIAALNLSLRHRLAELQAIFDTAPMGIAVAHDPKCCRITLNATGAEVLGLQPDQLLSFDAGDEAVLPFRAFCGGKELKPEELPMQRAAANNVDIRDEIVEHLFADGSRKLVSVNASPLLDEDGRVRGAVATLTDVTERTRIEEEIKRLNESLSSQNAELASANRELEAFSYSVSHDLRAPLRTMASFARFLLEDYADKLDGKGKDLLTRIGKASSKMTRLIDDLLSVSRISRQEVKRTDVDMSALTASIIGGLREAAPGRTVDVSIQEGLRASADATLIEVVLSNLIGNAWKFTSKTENAKLEFGSVQSEEKVTYYVRDNGAGFDTGHMNDMFQPFRRLHSENEFEGTGIGLTIVERIIHSHGGKIWAEAEVGKGATFYFTLE